MSTEPRKMDEAVYALYVYALYMWHKHAVNWSVIVFR